MIDRRSLVAGVALALALPRSGVAATAMTVFKDPSCGCCDAWVDHVRAAGFDPEVRNDPQMARVKARLGVPADLASCHTATVGGYVIEGHVPAAEIRRLLAQRPDLAGLAVPGMPVGSPGMEVEGMAPAPYDVVGFGARGQRIVFARYPAG